MIKSMTAFARQVSQGDWGSITCEVKTVNHRYLDCLFKMSDFLKPLEMQLRDITRTKIHRGHVECFLQYKPISKSKLSFSINEGLVNSLSAAIDQIKPHFKETKKIDLLKILSWPDVLQFDDEQLDSIHNIATQLYEQTLVEVVANRTNEGKSLQESFAAKLHGITLEVQNVKKHIPEVIKLQRDRINNRLEEIRNSFDPSRLEQEILLFTQRIDITEETERLSVHTKEFLNILAAGGCVGKRLDFLLQELHREANTIASKSVDTRVTNAAINIKVLIEQMREQVQNVE
jgi:uncharacterized protein (TIGR00255 family)